MADPLEHLAQQLEISKREIVRRLGRWISMQDRDVQLAALKLLDREPDKNKVKFETV